MSKIFKLFTFALIIFSLTAIYLSTIGVKTDRLNTTIEKKISEQDKNLKVNINDAYIKLDFFALSLKIILNNPDIYIKNIKLNVDDIESNVSISSLITKKPALKNLKINSKYNNIKDLLTIFRSYQNNFRTMMIDKLIKGGLTKFKFSLNFDESGKLKDDYSINGQIKNFKIDLLKNKNIQGELSYSIENNYYFANNLKFIFNNIEFNSKKIEIKKNKNFYFINGDIYNSETKINIKEFKNLININLDKFNVSKTKFNSYNDFSFEINEKFKVKNISIKSKIQLNELKYNVDEEIFFKIFGKTENILFKNQTINLTYTNLAKDGKGNILLKGQGEFEVNENKDNMNYMYSSKDNQNKINAKFNLDAFQLQFHLLNFEKNKNDSCSLEFEAAVNKNKNIKFNYLKLLNNDNILDIEDLQISSNKKITNLKKVKLQYLGADKKKYDINIIDNEKNFSVVSKNFDGAEIINNIFDGKNRSIIKNLNKPININILKLYIDEKNFVENVKGQIQYNNNEILNLNLIGNFKNKEIISITVVRKNEEVITNILTKYPKPIVDRYKFIKGFDEGILDFESIKRNNKSNSLLIIDNFKIKEVPALAKILTLASLQGIADLLTGEGIRFSDFEMKFSTQDNLLKIDELYAIGPAISILMNGYIEKDNLVSLRGTLVPATTINRTISSIPILGNILVGKKVGEGVFGVSFKVKGSPKNLKTTVNPIKTLTPRFITRTLEKIKN